MTSLSLSSLSWQNQSSHVHVPHQPWQFLKPVISRVPYRPCFCSSSLLSFSVVSTEESWNFDPLVTYFETPQERPKDETAQLDENSSLSVSGKLYNEQYADEQDDILDRASSASFVSGNAVNGVYRGEVEYSLMVEDGTSSKCMEQGSFFQSEEESGCRISGTASDEPEASIGLVEANDFTKTSGPNSSEKPAFSDQPKSEVSFPTNVQELEFAMKYKKVPHTYWVTLFTNLCKDGGIDTAKRLLKWMEKHGFNIVYDDLIAIIIGALGRVSSVSEAVSFAEEVKVKGAKSFNALIDACWMSNDFLRVIECVKKMRLQGVCPNVANYTFATQACIKAKVKSHVIVELYESMVQDKLQLDEKLYNDVIFAVSSASNAKQGLRVLQNMRMAGFIPSVAAYTSVIFALSNEGRIEEAESIFKDMKSFGRVPKIRTYNTLIRGYIRKGHLDQAEQTMQSMLSESVEPDVQTYNMLIDACVSAGKVEKAWALFQGMKRVGIQPTAFTYGRLMTAFKESGQWLSAIKTLRKMQESGVTPNKYIYNIAIDAFSKNKNPNKALEIFKKMRSDGIQPDSITWNSLIECHFRASKKQKALQLFSMMQAEGCQPSSRTYNILIDWLGRLNYWDDLKLILQDMKTNGLVPNAVTYTTLIDVYGQSGRFQDAFECLERMRTEFSEPVPSAYCALANAYARQGLCEQAVNVLKKMESDGIKINLLMLNSVLNSFSVAAKPEEGLAVFEYMLETGMTPDLVTYTTLMKGFIKAEKFDEALRIYDRMIQAGFTPDKRARDMRRFVTKFANKTNRPQLR